MFTVRHVGTFVLFCLVASTASAQSGANVLVVANEAVAGSLEIAERYAAARNVPAGQILRLKTVEKIDVTRAVYERTISQPIANWLSSQGAQDRILYIVLTRGMPLRIAGTQGAQGTIASVDSELTLLYRRMTGRPVPPGGPIPNPYVLDGQSLERTRPFRRAEHDIYLVTRLDGFTVADALALVERGQGRGTGGRVLLDDLAVSTDPRSKWLKAAAELLARTGPAEAVVHETTSKPLTSESGVVGYYSWGSNDRALKVRHPGLTFAPGAIAAMYLSTDARSFTEPPPVWVPGGTARTDGHDGSNQSLIADLVRSGVTGVAGQVSEPLISGAVRPDILFPAYLQGAGLAEAFYLAIPNLSWQTVVVGDPLARPFAQSQPTTEETPLDPATELPKHFSDRRVAAMTNAALYGKSEAGRILIVRADSRQARSDAAGAVQALEEAVRLEPTALYPWQLLGALHESASRYAEASKVYRRVLELDPNDIVSLNNLAYHVAVRENKPAEALGLANRAATLSRGAATIEDTVGWIHHLMGNDQEALPYLLRASRALVGNAEVQLHAAIVFTAVGRIDEAAKALDASLRADPSFSSRPDVQELKRKLGR